jgi:Xaa-Pro aminopeptidase
MRNKEHIQNEDILHNRQEKFYQELSKQGLDGLLISHQINIAYITGFPSRESYLLFSKKGNFFITDFRYFEEAKINLKNFLIKKAEGSLFRLIAGLARQLDLKKLGFEGKSLVFAEYAKIKEELGPKIDLVATDELVESLRQIKVSQ